MKKSLKITISVVVAVVILFAATVLALGFIRVNPIDKFFSDYSRVDIYDLNSSERLPDVGEGDTHQQRMSLALDKTSFSVLNAIISGKTDFKFNIVKNDLDEVVTLNAADVENLAATENSYMLCLHFDQKRSIPAKYIDGLDEDISFTRIYLFLTDGPNEVVTVRVIPVDVERATSVSDDENDKEFYKTYDLRLNIYAAKLYNDLQEIIQNVKG